MRGSLDDPPIIIGEARWKYLVFGLIVGVVAPFFFFPMVSPDVLQSPKVLVPLSMGGCFTWASTYLLNRAFRPALRRRLILNRNGVEFSEVKQGKRISTVVPWRKNQFFTVVVTNNGQTEIVLHRTIGGPLGREEIVQTFSGRWDLNRKRLVALLDEAHVHWRKETL